jgi:hypothetical protein
MEENEPQEGFKVVDKRRFASEGDPTEESSAPSASSETTDRTDQPPEAESQDAREPAKDLPPLSFSMLILDLANTVMFQLGLIRPAEGQEGAKDLIGARRTIDLIALLEEKTRGNLTDDEKKFIDETLYQLRIAYVEMAK